MAQYGTAQGAPAPDYRDYTSRGGAGGFFSRRGVAASILALTVLLGSFLGCYRSVSALRPAIAGTRVETLLTRRADVGLNLVTVAEKYTEDARVKALAETASTLRHTNDPAVLAASNALLGSYAEELMAALEEMPLTERDAAYLAGFRADLRGLEDQLLRDEYRTRAIAFNETIETVFPAHLVALLTGMERAPVF